MCDKILLILMFFLLYFLQIGSMIFAAHIDTEKNKEFFERIQKLILTTIEEMALQITIMVARIVGMITFH